MKKTLFIDDSKESIEAREILLSRCISFETIRTDDECELPSLIAPDSAVSFTGIDGIQLYADLFRKN